MKRDYLKSKEEIFKELDTSEKGLTNKEAGVRLKKYGKNEIKRKNKLQPIKILLKQFNSYLIYILLFSSIIMFFFNQIIDAVVIFAILLLNGGIGFFQEYKAEKAILGLKKMIIPKTQVIREEKFTEVPSAQLVPGDIVVFEQGDKINADCRIIKCENLQTNEAALTGESMPISKTSEALTEKEAALAKQKNMLFTGTKVVKGSAKAIVVSTGPNTVFGDIADTLQGIQTQKTPMQKRLDNFSRQLSYIIFALVFLILLLGYLQDFPLFQMFMTAVTLAIGAIPEGLPAVLAITFAISSVILSKQNVIIRKLPAVETLGSVTVICSDKTGTITEEKMTVKKLFSGEEFYNKTRKGLFSESSNKKISISKKEEIQELFITSVLCNNSKYEFNSQENKYTFFGDPTENALLSASLDLGIEKKPLTKEQPSLRKIEFDSERKMMSVLRDYSDSENILYSKGAPEKILEKASHEMIDGKKKPISDKRRNQLLENSRKMEKDALRVLAFAFKTLKKDEKPSEQDIVFLGFLGMIDPPRKEVKTAIQNCKNSGIKVKLITGDSPATATAIAKQIGIEGETLTEKELEDISDNELLNKIDNVSIFARATPQQKLRITKILQQKKEVVAITGDGINDVLALKSADIGIAMGQRGTDIARDVSDVVLADDNFASIVQGVKHGRTTYDNIKKFAKYMLSVNFSGIMLITLSMIMASIFGPEKWYLPLLPLQILWINLITDSFPAITLALEKQEDSLNSRPRKEKSLLEGIWSFVLIAGLFTLLIKTIAYVFGVTQGFEPEKTRTIVLTTVVLFEIFFVYTCRSDKLVIGKGFFSNKWLNYAIVFSLILHLVLLYTPLGMFFDVIPLTLNDWFLIIPLSLSGLFVFEIGKMIREKRIKKLINAFVS